MRIYEKSLVTISEDASSSPDQILFQNNRTEEDLLSCSECKNTSDIFPIATTVVSMGNITAGKYIFVKPTLDCTLVLSGENIALTAGKVFSGWCEFTSVSIIEAVAPNKIMMVIAGD